MEKLSMCRICLAENIRMDVVVNKNLHELYEKLTNIPFVTEDIQPILACFICCAKLKQCYRLMTKCLKAEELFAKMLSESYKPNHLVNQDHFKIFGGLVRTPIESINIVDTGLTEIIVVKEEFPAVCARLDDTIEPKEEHQSNDLKQEILEIAYSDEEDILLKPHHYEKFSEDDVPLIAVKIEMEKAVSKQKRTRVDTNRPAVAEEPILCLRRTKSEDSIPAHQKTNQVSDSTVIRNIRDPTSKSISKFKKPYECDICLCNFSKKSDLTKHVRMHTSEKPYKCDVCQCSFTQKGNLRSHIRTHTDEKPYKCNVCQLCFKGSNDLKQHIRIHSSEKPYKCDVCQCVFGIRRYLVKHIRTHIGEKPYKCDVCQRSFSQRAHLTGHIRTHTGEKPYKCDVCQVGFGSKSNLTLHIRKHTGEKPYKCELCQRSFNAKAHLTVHFRTHTGEKPYKCDVCQVCFTSKDVLTKHIRIHTGEKPYKCELCERSFSQKAHLTVHFRTHTGERPYKCNLCQRCFKDSSDLKKHIRIHTGERPYQCDKCQRSFNVMSNLKKHNCTLRYTSIISKI